MRAIVILCYLNYVYINQIRIINSAKSCRQIWFELILFGFEIQ